MNTVSIITKMLRATILSLVLLPHQLLADQLYNDLLFLHQYDTSSCSVGHVESWCESTNPGAGQKYIHGYTQEFWDSLTPIYMSESSSKLDHIWANVKGKKVFSWTDSIDTKDDYSKTLFDVPSLNPGKVIIFNFFENYYTLDDRPFFEYSNSLGKLNDELARALKIPVVSISIPVSINRYSKNRKRFHHEEVFIKFLEANGFLESLNIDADAKKLLSMEPSELDGKWPIDYGIFVFFAHEKGDRGSLLYSSIWPGLREVGSLRRVPMGRAMVDMRKQAVPAVKSYFGVD